MLYYYTDYNVFTKSCRNCHSLHKMVDRFTMSLIDITEWNDLYSIQKWSKKTEEPRL